MIAENPNSPFADEAISKDREMEQLSVHSRGIDEKLQQSRSSTMQAHYNPVPKEQEAQSQKSNISSNFIGKLWLEDEEEEKQDIVEPQQEPQSSVQERQEAEPSQDGTLSNGHIGSFDEQLQDKQQEQLLGKEQNMNMEQLQQPQNTEDYQEITSREKSIEVVQKLNYEQYLVEEVSVAGKEIEQQSQVELEQVEDKMQSRSQRVIDQTINSDQEERHTGNNRKYLTDQNDMQEKEGERSLEFQTLDQKVAPSLMQHKSFMKSLNVDQETLERLFQAPIQDLDKITTKIRDCLLQAEKQENQVDALNKFFSEHYKPLGGMDMQKLLQKYTCKLKRYKSSYYFGEVFNNNRHGLGILIQMSEPISLYEGCWQNNLRFGRGFQVFHNGNIYSGFFLNGKPEGFGCFYWQNGDVYTGQWLQGVKHGSGLWTGSKGDEYLGEWKEGSADGYGVHKWLNGDRYEGQFKHSLKHGNGIERFANGDRYMGDYQNGKPCGYGEYTWANGTSYKGIFFNGLRDGRGVWKRKASGGQMEVYEGDWVNDRRSGEGVYRYGNGCVYSGSFANNLRHGYGQLIQPTGEIIQGWWEWGQITSKQERSRGSGTPVRQTTYKSDYSFFNETDGNKLYSDKGSIPMINEESETEMLRSSIEQRQVRTRIQFGKIEPNKTKIRLSQDARKSTYRQNITSYDQSFDKTQRQVVRRQGSVRQEAVSHRMSNASSPKKLSNQELRRWEIKSKNLKIQPSFYNNLDDQRVVNKIRRHINPPIWKPAGIEQI